MLKKVILVITFADFNGTLMNRYGNGHCVLLSCHKGEWELITSQFTQQSCNIDGNVVGKCGMYIYYRKLFHKFYIALKAI